MAFDMRHCSKSCKAETVMKLFTMFKEKFPDELYMRKKSKKLIIKKIKVLVSRCTLERMFYFCTFFSLKFKRTRSKKTVIERCGK